MEDAILECEQATNRRTVTRTVDDSETHYPTDNSSLGPQTLMEMSSVPRGETLERANCMLDNPSGFGDVE